MRSRYSAYAVGESGYIVKTTHPNNPDYTKEVNAWRESIQQFTDNTEFLGLEIVEVIEGEEESFVTFKAQLSSGEMLEKSRFLRVEGRWFYVDGVVE